MKKNVYQAPEMEVAELKNKLTLLAGSGETPPPFTPDPGESDD